MTWGKLESVGGCAKSSGTRHWPLLVAGLVMAVIFASLASPVQASSPGLTVSGAVAPTHLPPTTSEVQEVSVDATGGTFVLEFDGEATAPVPFDADASELEAALGSLAKLSGMNAAVSVKGGPGNSGAEQPYFVWFESLLSGIDVPQMSADGAGLTGAAPGVIVSTEVQGVSTGAGSLAVFPMNIGGAPTTAPVEAVIGPLPLGIVTAGAAEAAGWSCPVGLAAIGKSEITCSLADSVDGLVKMPVIKVPLLIEGTVAAPSSSVLVRVTGGGATADASFTVPIVVSSTLASPGLQAFDAGSFDENGEPETQAGAHPYSGFTVFLRNTVLSADGKSIFPAGNLRDVIVNLPPGFIVNPLLTRRCPESTPVPISFQPGQSPRCEDDSALGYLEAFATAFGNRSDFFKIYNNLPGTGYPGKLSTKVIEPIIQSLLPSVRSDSDYGITATAPNIANYFKLFGSAVVLEGFPFGAGGKPVLTNPTSCGQPVSTVSIEANTWPQRDLFASAFDAQPLITGCDKLDFNPEFTFQPSATAGSTGVETTAHLHVAQEGLLGLDEEGNPDPEALAPPHLKDSTVVLPEGLSLNPSAATGLEACSMQQVGFKGSGFSKPNPMRFDKTTPSCPDGSKIGTVEVETPLLEDPLAGTIYLAAQGDNPFKSLLAMYLVVDDAKTGTVLKLPGKVTPDQKTGQLTAQFDNNPQLPFSDLLLKFRGGGPRSTIATPDVCGKYTTKGTFTPWSAPASGPPAQTEDSFTIDRGVGGSVSCPQTKAQRPFGLGFEAGSTNPVAGAHSPFTLRITRPDGNQEIDKVSVATPPGFAATLAGVAVCSDAQLAQALARSNPGDGKAELDSPSCPASSQVGTTTIGAGVGSQPYYVKTGKVYRTGPYKGAKQSLTFIVPAVAGPFDLGVQVVRTALQVNPVTAQITAESDPIPQILQGIPLQIRDIRVDLNRPNFTINPTNCNAMAVNGQITGGSGAVANVTNRFQVGNCAALGFTPSLKLRYKGATKRGGNPALRAVLTQPGGQANISSTQVILPRGSFIDNEHINNPCTRAQYAANACPASSILGTATAWSPLLEQPLSGYVYFRSNGGERELPDLVASLKGDVDVELVGFIDAVVNKKNGVSRVRNTFALVPDAPVSRFELSMKGGKFGLIENSKNLCQGTTKATVKMGAHNGKTYNSSPIVQTDCRKKKGQKKSGRSSQAVGRMHR